MCLLPVGIINKSRVEKEQERQKINHDKKVVEHEFDVGENV